MMKKLIIILLGIVLAIGVLATGAYGLTEENIEIYEQAVAMQRWVEKLGFENFALTDYPVAFYDGERDYVLIWREGTYSIEKRHALINSIAATAYPVDDHYEVLTPTVEKMSSLLGLMSAGKSEYGTSEHISTLWHEAFHCYQLTNYLDNIEAICPTGVDESIIAEYVDTNTRAVSLFEQQAALLEEAVKCDAVDKLREYIVQYKELDVERRELLSEDVLRLEEYYTRVEGTACYMEACVYKMQVPDKFEGNYIDSISEYGGGSGKYYKTGMAQCMIMDKLNAEWKQSYDFSEPIIKLIYKELEIEDDI